MIANYLKNKQLKLLNKKFNKFRKIVFLIAFDRKLTGLASILQAKVEYNKRDSFKDLINYCIRNDSYKRQVQVLSNEYQQQRLQLVKQHFSRTVKIAKSYLL